jgi:glycosyltransferase involved in cell wall biosynthesis
MRRLRIAQVAPPLERVPPPAYGGTERIVHELVTELVRRGHDVTTYATADSDVPGRLIPIADQPLRRFGHGWEAGGFFVGVVANVLDDADRYDLIHSHLEWFNPILAKTARVPVVGTFHGRLDFPWMAGVLGERRLHRVAISENQARIHSNLAWTVIHNGLSLDGAPFGQERTDDLCFVGRVAPEKGIVEAMDVARRTGRRLRIAAKIGTTVAERGYYEEVFKPALERSGSLIEFLGEIAGPERDRLISSSYATLMPGQWPEPFGLVAIESLACGTPVIARRIGALPEIIRHGRDGFFGDDAQQLAYYVDKVATLDRAAIRASVLERFSATRMADDYEELYERILTGRSETGLGAITSPADDVGRAVGPGRPTWASGSVSGGTSRSSEETGTPSR